MSSLFRNSAQDPAPSASVTLKSLPTRSVVRALSISAQDTAASALGNVKSLPARSVVRALSISAQDPAASALGKVKSSPARSVVRVLVNRWLAPLWLVTCCLALPAQIHKVDPERTITFPVAGATAAYTMDSFLAEASAENGVVSIVGIHPGTTHVVVVTSSEPQTFEVFVTTPPPIYPPGFVTPDSGPEGGQTGYYEGRYYTNPAQIQEQFDFFKTNGENWTHMHVVETNLLGALEEGQSRAALSSATYEIHSPDRDITFLDKYLDLSELTINGSIIRGFHMEQDNWFVHAGYTSVAAFEGMFLPLQPELIVGGGYRYPLTGNSSITASFYDIQVHASDRLGRSGTIGDLRYKYRPREDFWFTTDLGISHGVGAAGRLRYRTARDNVVGLVRYMPLGFAALGVNNLRGLHTDFSWTRHVTPKFEASSSFYNNNLVLPGIRENTIAASVNLRYQLVRHWAATGGALASSFQTKVPLMPAIRNLTLPAGVAFQSKHFGGAGQYQFGVTPGSDTGAKQYRANLQSGWGAFTASAYGQRDTNTPTLNFIFTQETGLQALLEEQGIRATSVQQLDELLSSDSFLIAAGYIKGASINLVPVRTQVGATADWAKRGVHKRDLSYSFLYNDNESLLGSTVAIAHTVSLTQSITRSDSLSLSCSIMGLKDPGEPEVYTPICFAAWRHQFQHVPYFIIPERRGTITGTVYRDDQSVGEFKPGMPPLPEVEVMLDDRRRTLTGTDGSYRFPNVPRGKHKIEALYSSRDPFFFTTPSKVEVEEDATTDFGVGFTLSGLTGAVLNDAGEGVAGVNLAIESRGRKWTATTEGDGGYFVPALVAGDYTVQAEEDSLPEGYSTDGLGEPRQVTVGASSPGKADFTVRALRSISGRVLSYDPAARQYVPANGAHVVLGEPALAAMTDLTGRYLFRDLAAGSYTVSVQTKSQTSTQTVRLGGPPVDLANVDFQIGPPLGASAPNAPAPVAPLASARPPASTHVAPPPASARRPNVAAPAVKSFGSLAVTPEQHNILGRELTRAGRYREAVVEFTEALRLAPDFALALNARGFALFKLHDGAAALADLDRAIRINSSYVNAYRVRAAARRSIGDAAGAAADLTRAEQLDAAR